jgi:hypothetical protein
VEPEDGPTVDLPYGCGVVGVRLGPETKSSRNKAVDMFLAYQCLSAGYHLGKWFHRGRRSCGIGADYSYVFEWLTMTLIKANPRPSRS